MKKAADALASSESVSRGPTVDNLSARHEAHPARSLSDVEASCAVGLLALSEHAAVLASLEGDNGDDDLNSGTRDKMISRLHSATLELGRG